MIADSDLTDSPAWQRSIDSELKATVYQRGEHSQGNFVRVYVPEAAQQPGSPVRVILYLHGFALCLPSFYEDHLKDLVRQGWIVIFPDFQRSSYPVEPLEGESCAAQPTPRPTWGTTTRRLIRRKGTTALRSEDLPEGLKNSEATGGLPTLLVRDLRRVLLSWFVIRILLGVIGLVRRTYARHLEQLIETVLLSLAYAPKIWLANAVALGEQALEDLSREPGLGHWREQTMTAYGFGHSLGGLLSLSVPSLPADQAARRLQPTRVLAADPATNTEMGIPAFAIWLLKLFGAPFTADPFSIQDTGAALEQPVAILHGLDDTMVPPALWSAADGSGGFLSIASRSKALYFAHSNTSADPSLIAFHNQAVTSTTYYDDALFRNFGGVKHGPNAYNSTWIWPALTLLFNGLANPDELLIHLTERPFVVTKASSATGP